MREEEVEATEGGGVGGDETREGGEAEAELGDKWKGGEGREMEPER